MAFLSLLSHNYIPDHWRHQLLWHSFLEELHQLEPDQLALHKVHSHGCPSLVEGSVEEWLIHGNDKADEVAFLPISFEQFHFRTTIVLFAHIMFVRLV